MKKFILSFILISFNLKISFCQTTEIKNLVFEGAGIRGIAYTGVITELEQQKRLDSLQKVGGTSAGAIIALALSLGYNAKEITDIIYNTKFQQFNDGKYIFIGGLYRMNSKFGWYQGNSFSKWLENLIVKKTGSSDITFKELHDKGFKDLYVTATSLNNQKLIVFSKDSYPQMKIKDAVRISMSVPLYFEAIIIDSLGNIIDKPGKKDMYYDVVVDGGIIGNFPIEIFDSIIIKGNDKYRIANKYTLGIRIDSDEQISYDEKSKALAPHEVKNLIDYIEAFYIFAIENLNRNKLTEEDWQRTISVSSSGIGPKVKKLSESQKELLINSGITATRKYYPIRKN
ncbi:MAG: patatin-like phospholipase family protein [Cytophagaceae bacterium]